MVEKSKNEESRQTAKRDGNVVFRPHKYDNLKPDLSHRKERLGMWIDSLKKSEVDSAYQISSPMRLESTGEQELRSPLSYLCDLYVSQTGRDGWARAHGGIWEFDGWTEYPSAEVISWAGLTRGDVSSVLAHSRGDKKDSTRYKDVIEFLKGI